MKLALLYAFRSSEWKSCISITDNIKSSYSLLKHEIQYFDYDHLKGELHLETLADELSAFKPDRIIFIDHRPTPKQLLERLLKRKIDVPLIIHLYGDFSVYCNDWIEQEAILKNFKVQFITASQSQHKFVSQFFNKNNNQVKKVSFAVDQKAYQHEEQELHQFYKTHELNPQSMNFIYAGRITKQKNVTKLATLFKQEILPKNPMANLIIAGDIDDQGSPFHGEYLAAGTTQLQLESSLGPNIKWIGSLSSQELATAYNACDCFISLSTFHDEDFGMAPLEAAATGLPLILTGWGGYHDFIKEAANSKKIEVIYENGFYRYNEKQVIHSILEHSKPTKEDKKYQSKVILEKFSLEKIASEFEEILKDKKLDYFVGFNRSFWEFTRCFRNNPSKPFDPENKITQLIYSECYRAYTS